MEIELEASEIGNYYGSLTLSTFESKFYWGIENYDGIDWEEIPESLYSQIKEFEESKSV